MKGARKVKDAVRRELSSRNNTPLRTADPPVPDRAPDQYLALPPCGEPIPAMVSPTEPGVRVCCLFKLERVAPDDDEDLRKVITQIRNAADDGTLETQTQSTVTTTDTQSKGA